MDDSQRLPVRRTSLETDRPRTVSVAHRLGRPLRTKRGGIRLYWLPRWKAAFALARLPSPEWEKGRGIEDAARACGPREGGSDAALSWGLREGPVHAAVSRARRHRRPARPFIRASRPCSTCQRASATCRRRLLRRQRWNSRSRNGPRPLPPRGGRAGAAAPAGRRRRPRRWRCRRGEPDAGVRRDNPPRDGFPSPRLPPAYAGPAGAQVKGPGSRAQRMTSEHELHRGRHPPGLRAAGPGRRPGIPRPEPRPPRRRGRRQRVRRGRLDPGPRQRAQRLRPVHRDRARTSGDHRGRMHLPVGFNCKHVAAALLFWLDIEGPIETAPPSPEQRIDRCFRRARARPTSPATGCRPSSRCGSTTSARRRPPASRRIRRRSTSA